MLSIIDRYILREASKSFAAVLSVLMLILITNGLVRVLQSAASGDLANEVVLKMFGVQSLLVLAQVTPPAFFFSILYSLGRMYRDSEMTALAAGGVGLRRIYRAYLMLAAPLTLLVAGLTLTANPYLNQLKAELKEAQTYGAEVAAAIAGKFTEFKDGTLVFYVEDLSDNGAQLHNVFIQNRKHGKLGIITAAHGHQYLDEASGDRFVVLSDGRRYEGEPGGEEFSVGEFESYGIRIAKEDQEQNSLPRNAIPTAELMESDEMRDRSEVQYRFTLPFTLLVFTLVSIPLARALPREGIYGRLFLALLFYFMFMNLLGASDIWMRQGVTPLWMGRWWVHPATLLLAAGLFFLRSPRAERLWQKLLHRPNGGRKR